MNYKKLDVWIHSMDLAVDVYAATRRLPKEEQNGLCTQMQRAAVSVPSNVAEGEGRCSARDHLRFLGHARGSLYELETQIIICERLGYLKADGFADTIAETGRLLNGTIRYLANKARRIS